MGYRETAAPAPLGELIECRWTNDTPHRGARVLPDGCMDLIAIADEVIVAGPDITAVVSDHASGPLTGLRFLPGVLPRLLGVPASELTGQRVPLGDLCDVARRPLILDALAVSLAADGPRNETAPWSLSTLHHVTHRLAMGSRVSGVADEIGWSVRTVRRQCETVYGYGPATLRRILRFRRVVELLRAETSTADAAAAAGYADQPHMHREVRGFAGVSVSQLANGANRSTDVPSASTTVA